MEALQTFIDMLLSSNILVYLGLVADGIVSFLLWKKSKHVKSGSTAEEDLTALIEYHENVAKKLREKFKKE